MASAAFQLAPDGTTYGDSPQAVDSDGATVRCRLLSVSGVNSGQIVWTCEGTNNPSVAKPTLTPSGSPLGQIVSFDVPSGANQAYIIQCEVNGGPDVNGDAATRARGKFYVLNNAGRQPIAFFETYESDSTHGTFKIIDEINDGAAIGSWIEYTPTLTSASGSPSIGNGSIVGFYRLVGDTMELNLQLTIGSSTTLGTGTLSFSLPEGYVVDISKLPPSGIVGFYLMGGGTLQDSDTPANNVMLSVYKGDVGSTLVVVPPGSATPVSSSAPFTIEDGDVISIGATIPVTAGD